MAKYLNVYQNQIKILINVDNSLTKKRIEIDTLQTITK
jgi:hypothetical protein